MHALQDLTQYNTAHNRQISMVGIQENQRSRKRKSTSSISFAEEEEIINMEDVDPSVGKFRNMITTTIIPKVRGAGSWGVYSLGTTLSVKGRGGMQWEGVCTTIILKVLVRERGWCIPKQCHHCCHSIPKGWRERGGGGEGEGLS